MSRPVLILGGAGNFGKRIAVALTKKKLPVIIVGRSKEKAEALGGDFNLESVEGRPGFKMEVVI